MQTDDSYDGLMLETCVTVTWMKLMHRLYRMTHHPKYWMKWRFLRTMRLRGSQHAGATCGAETTFDEPVYRQVYDCATAVQGGQVFDSYSPLRAGIRGRAVGGFKSMRNGAAYCGCCIAIGAGRRLC